MRTMDSTRNRNAQRSRQRLDADERPQMRPVGIHAGCFRLWARGGQCGRRERFALHVIVLLEGRRTDGQLTHGPPQTDGPPADTDRPPAGAASWYERTHQPTESMDGWTSQDRLISVNLRYRYSTGIVPWYILTDTGCVYTVVTPPVLRM